MNLVTVAIAGGGAYLLWKGASMKAPPAAAGPGSQVPINPAGAGGSPTDLMDHAPNSTDTGGSNGAPPAGACVTCAPSDAGLQPIPPKEEPVPAPKPPSTSGSGSVSGGGILPRPPGTTAPVESATSSGAYSAYTSKQAYISYKTGGYNGMA